MYMSVRRHTSKSDTIIQVHIVRESRHLGPLKSDCNCVIAAKCSLMARCWTEGCLRSLAQSAVALACKDTDMSDGVADDVDSASTSSTQGRSAFEGGLLKRFKNCASIAMFACDSGMVPPRIVCECRVTDVSRAVWQVRD